MKFEIYISRPRNLSFFLSYFVAATLSFVAFDGGYGFGLATLLIFVGLCHLCRAYGDREPELVICPKGIAGKNFNVAIIPWGDITAIKVSRAEIIAIEVTTEFQEPNPSLFNINKKKQFFIVSNKLLDLDTNQLLAILNAMHALTPEERTHYLTQEIGKHSLP